MLNWTTEKLALAGGEMSGNITMNGTETVDGRDLSVDGAKLDAIEAGATADQTAAQVVSTATTNIAALTVQTALAELDDEKLALAGGEMSGNITMNGTETVDGRDLSVDGAKLDAIEAGATADQTAAQVVSTATTNIAALTVQTALAELDDEKLALAGGEMSGNITMNGTETVDGRDLSVDGAKLDAIEAGATADQTAAQVVSTATTNIAALTVQTALAELDDEKLALAGGEMSGNITMNGTETVDGRDLSVDGAKLDAIEAGATADQTAAQVVSTATTNIAALTVQTALAELDDEKLALAGGDYDSAILPYYNESGTATTFSGDLNGTSNPATTATTQTAADNSTN